MRLVKCLPVALAAILSIALFGAPAAGAESTALCNSDVAGTACPESNQVTHVHYVGDIEVLTVEMNYTCDALFLGVTSGLGAPLTVEGNFTYGNCDQGCTREEISEGTTLEILRTGEEFAEVAGLGAEIEVNCSGVISCVWSLEGITGSMEGPLKAGSDGRIVWEMAPLQKVSGFLCPASAYLHARFEPLAPLFVKS